MSRERGGCSRSHAQLSAVIIFFIFTSLSHGYALDQEAEEDDWPIFETISHLKGGGQQPASESAISTGTQSNLLARESNSDAFTETLLKELEGIREEG
eukprot:1111569-Rhodomonas_salina.3